MQNRGLSLAVALQSADPQNIPQVSAVDNNSPDSRRFRRALVND